MRFLVMFAVVVFVLAIGVAGFGVIWDWWDYRVPATVGLIAAVVFVLVIVVIGLQDF